MSNYCCTDLHGMYNLYQQIQEFLKPDDKVYFFGDAIDRGPQPWKLMKEILNNPQWIYLCGNHEDMAAQAILAYDEGADMDSFYGLLSNGGAQTLDSWMREGAWVEWASVFKKLPYFETYVNKDNITIYLTHAGFTPKADSAAHLVPPSRFECLWNRSHFCEAWDEEHFGQSIVIHGHTPVPYLIYNENEKEKINAWNEPSAFYYRNDHKINLDCGACWTNAVVLLDLDTFDEYIFQI